MSALLDLLLPPRCLACARVVGPTGTGWPGVDPPLCDRCTGELTRDGEGWVLCPGVVAIGLFAYADPLAVAIKRVKTDGMHAGARGLASLVHPHLPARTPRTWVPAPPARRRRRGLDLPEVLAGAGALPLIAAVGDRRDQGELDARARRRAAVGGYTAIAPVPPAVVLVDDVRATGATLLAAATALRHGGARRVLAVSLAASPGRPSAAHPPRAVAAGPGRGSAAASGRSS